MDTSQLKLMRRHRRSYRFVGFVWTLVGGLLTVTFVASALTPGATIVSNGVVTSALGPKVVAACFTTAFFLAGLAFLFAPARYLDRLFVWRQSLLSVLMFWRRPRPPAA